MKSRVFVCSFTGAIGDMKACDQRDQRKVLSVLSDNPRFSVFDATERPAISNTLTKLHRTGMIEYQQPQPGFPWNHVVVTDKGREYMDCSK